MRFVVAVLFILFGLNFTFGQNEQAPIVEREFTYKDWVYKDVKTGSDRNLRKVTFGKKLVMVVYWAPWCPNWRHDAPFVQRMYEKYKSQGFDVIGVGEYDTVNAMKTSLDNFKITFNSVYESESKDDREKTEHFNLRRKAGDNRKWGSPWYVFLEVPKLEPAGLIMFKNASVVNGELIEAEAEKFIREKLGLPKEELKVSAADSKIEVCDPAKPTANTLVKP